MNIREDEERRKERVYGVLLGQQTHASGVLQQARNYVASGKYEDQDAYVAYGRWDRAREGHQKAAELVKTLYDKPYFAHVGIDASDESGAEHYYLSDAPDLDEMVEIDEDAFLIPFKADPKRPMFSALLHAYQMKTDESFRIDKTKDDSPSFTLELIRDVEIDKRRLIDVTPVYPVLATDEEAARNADDLLAEKLIENRQNAQLRNIIATLQAQQFDIIRTDVHQSFVVQGCPGSGKTQCLIHRLFFLRDLLGDRWNRVLLITPTQVFRNYSAPLMRRFHLTDIQNASLAAFYQMLLMDYDPRFRSRQYRIELSEEYLPDAYLHAVYAPEQMQRIENEIESAICKHVQEACDLLRLPFDETRKITMEEIDGLVQKLESALEAHDEREKAAIGDEAFLQKRAWIEQLEKRNAELERRMANLQENQNGLLAKCKEYDVMLEESQKADQELREWEEGCRRESDLRTRNLELAADRMQQEARMEEMMACRCDYMKALRDFWDESVEGGKRFEENRVYRELLEEICRETKEKLKSFCKSRQLLTWRKKTDEHIQQNLQKMSEIALEKDKAEQEIMECRSWLEKNGGRMDLNKKHRASLERSRYYLSRLESAVFEQEVWQVTAQLKRQNGIQSLAVEEMPDGHRRETRVLYKSDLLFYLMIYTYLYPTHTVPPYEMICIDEGQDLHPADYRMLRRLYPHANLNVFGDTSQALHEECGISEWKTDTGIEMVYQLDRNYRNDAAIVDFCNKHFDCEMGCVGSVERENTPVVVDKASTMAEKLNANLPLIVRDREALSVFCREADIPIDRFEYIDTHTEQIESGRIPCYSIFAAKGLEFPESAVFARRMNQNQRLVACTRAMNRLYYCE